MRREDRGRGSGFGFYPEVSQHHFKVTIDRARDGQVTISEHVRSDERAITGPEDARVRVVLHRRQWADIAPVVALGFNQRLKHHRGRTGRWLIGSVTPIEQGLGKELVVLAWGIETAQSEDVLQAIDHWEGLKPEERRWIYTMTAAAHGRARRDRGRGWRAAIGHMLVPEPSETARPALKLNGGSRTPRKVKRQAHAHA